LLVAKFDIEIYRHSHVINLISLFEILEQILRGFHDFRWDLVLAWSWEHLVFIFYRESRGGSKAKPI